MQQILVAQLRKDNIALATVLEKALRWECSESEIKILLPAGYEAERVRNKENALKKTISELGLPPVSVEISNDKPQKSEQDRAVSSRAELVCEIFYGQIIEGKNNESNGSF